MKKRKADVAYLIPVGPPSSPPTVLVRLSRRTNIVMAAPEQKIVTEKARL